MAVAADKTKWERDADALPSARRLFGYSAMAILLLAISVFGAAVFAVFQIDDAAVGHELSRARVALTAISVETEGSEAALAVTLGTIHGFEGAHIGVTGDVASISAGEVAVPIPGTDRQLIWTPRRLGSELFMQLAPIRVITSLVFMLGIAFAMRRLYLLACELEGRRVQARALATRDALTSLGNRLAFNEGMARLLDEGMGELALLYLDLDGFKQVNDTLGHGAGDEVLRTVAERLSKLVQPVDLLVRLGGDEFVVLRGEYASRDELAQLAITIKKALAEPVQLGARALQVGVSIGIATAPADGTSGTELLEAADSALYRAKRDRTGFAMATAA